MKVDRLLLQVVWPDGTVFKTPAGERLEVDLEGEMSKRLRAKGVGILRTTNHVEKDFREAFREALFALKDRVANP